MDNNERFIAKRRGKLLLKIYKNVFIFLNITKLSVQISVINSCTVHTL